MVSTSDSSDGGIPRILHSIHDGAPFKACVECGGSLLLGGVPYAVEKVVRSGEVVFEYALCATCTMGLLREFSEESIQNIHRYLESERELVDPHMMERLFWALGTDDEGRDDAFAPPPLPLQHLDRCQRCGRGGSGFSDEHTVMGMLVGSKLVTGINTICGPCTDGMDQILSTKTRDLHDDFVGRNFPGVPANLDIPIGIFGM